MFKITVVNQETNLQVTYTQSSERTAGLAFIQLIAQAMVEDVRFFIVCEDAKGCKYWEANV